MCTSKRCGVRCQLMQEMVGMGLAIVFASHSVNLIQSLDLIASLILHDRYGGRVHVNGVTHN